MPIGSYKCLLKQILENSSSNAPTDPETDAVVDSSSSEAPESSSSKAEPRKMANIEVRAFQYICPSIAKITAVKSKIFRSIPISLFSERI